MRRRRAALRRACISSGPAIAEVCREPLILMTSVAQAAQFVLNGSLNAFLPLFALEVLGAAPATVGWLFALQTVTTLAVRPLIGVLSDRTGRRGVIVTGLLVCSSGVFLVSLASGLLDLGIAIVLYAIGVAVTTAAAAAFISDLTRGARYGAAHGVFGTIYDVGDALGPILGGALVATIGYSAMFRVMAAITLTASCRVLCGVASGDRPAQPAIHPGSAAACRIHAATCASSRRSSSRISR